MKGRCMCGAVTISAQPARKSFSACHCEMCRRWTSSMLMTLPAAPGTLTAEGPVRRFQSSDWAERAFCDTCGSALWYRITAEGPGHGVHQLAAGLFDLSGMHLGLELFIDAKPDAYAFAGARRRMTAQECFDMFEPKADE